MVLIENAVEKANQYLRGVMGKLPYLSPFEVGIPKGVHKKEYKTRNPWFEGIKYSEKHFGWRFREDRKPLLIYVKHVKGKPRTDAICIQDDLEKLPASVSVDWNKMKEKLITRKFTELLEAIGLTWLDVTSKTKATKLVAYQ